MVKRHGRALRAAASVLALGLATATTANAQAVDHAALFKSKVLKCVHPTVNADKATYEVSKGPETAGDTTTTRFKVFYAGLLGGKNSMDADMMVRQAGSIRQMRVNVLSDTGTTVTKCPLTAGWTDF